VTQPLHVFRFAAASALVAALIACRGETALLPQEVFHWSGQPVAFRPPPEGWRREGELSGGVRGVRFVKEHGLGEAITVGELHRVGERDRAPAIRELIEEMETLDRRKLLRKALLAHSRTDDMYSEAESAVARDVNAALDRAMRAKLDNDLKLMRHELETALRAAQRLQLTLDDVLAPLRKDRFASTKDRDLSIGGKPAVAFEWTMQHNGRTYHRRELYVLHRNHLFTAHFIGLDESLGLFDRVVGSIEFPE
jgi:hypothetical protein